MPTRFPPLLRRLAIALLTLAVGLAVAWVLPWKLNPLRGWIGERVQAATGRTLVIDGDLWWRFGRHGRLTAEGVRIGNPAWAGRADFLQARRVELEVALWPLLRGRIVLPQVRAEQPDLWLERAPDGRRSWRLERAQNDGKRTLYLGSVALDRGVVTYAETARRAELRFAVQTRVDDGRPRLQAEASGRWNDLPVQAHAEGDEVLQLRNDDRPYAFELDGRIGSTSIAASGSVLRPREPERADLRLKLAGGSLGEWHRIAGVGLPDTPPYKTEGRLRFDGVRWTYEDFSAVVGRSDLGGRVAYERRAPRPLLSGELVSSSLDLADFGPVIGQARRSGAGRTGAAAPAAADGARRVLPQQRLDADKWGTLDADVHFVGQEVRNLGRFPIGRLDFRVKMDDRRLTLSPLLLQLGGGRLEGELHLDGRAQPMAARLDLKLRRLQLDTLLPQLRSTKSALGAINGRLALAGQGPSFARMLGSADGEAQLAMGRGQVSNLLLELLDLDAYESLKFLVRGDRAVEVRCALVDVGFQRGQMSTRAAVFDTVDTVIEARGRADFANEQLDLRVTPTAKDLSPLSARVPFDVKGPFAQPQVSPDKARLLARGGGALLLGLVNPLAALLPLIETGPGEDRDCSALTARAQPPQNRK
ncbi:AsmA family protein [Methylibium sp. Pch-M]|uniref:AsmA family protein n=1 Tax=Methylibium sp. Pch-M TaxID=2082386 RepID=UPI0013ED8882|nr:AsmA family protein [Methylibium sp. Pch-M]